MCDNLTGVCTCGLAGHSHHHHEHDGGHAPFHRLFGELHETYESEFGSISPSTPDDDGTAAARKTANENPTAENLLALAGALCFQLRYKEAAEFYEKYLQAPLQTTPPTANSPFACSKRATSAKHANCSQYATD